MSCDYDHINCCGEKKAAAFASCHKERDGSWKWLVAMARIICNCKTTTTKGVEGSGNEEEGSASKEDDYFGNDEGGSDLVTEDYEAVTLDGEYARRKSGILPSFG